MQDPVVSSRRLGPRLPDRDIWPETGLPGDIERSASTGGAGRPVAEFTENPECLPGNHAGVDDGVRFGAGTVKPWFLEERRRRRAAADGGERRARTRREAEEEMIKEVENNKQTA